ncbi:MAG: cytochrome C [Methylococcales bacterium]|nr:cytochrome C [Methylococcales bacterium]
MHFVIQQLFFAILLFAFPFSNVWADDGEDLSGYTPTYEIAPISTPSITMPVTMMPPVVATTNSAIGNTVDFPTIHPAIPLLDETGQHVLDSQKPYSTRTSCGGGAGCHDIDKISHAYHFEMGRDESDDKFGLRRGLAALTSPAYFGGYSCQNGNNPSWLSKKMTTKEADFLDYGAVGLIKNCEECHTGGGFAEKDRVGKRYDSQPENAVSFLDGDYFEWNGKKIEQWDWQKSGVIEPDCMACHADISKFKRPVSEWKTQRNVQIIKNGWFRYANSAIFAFLDLLPDSVDGQTLATLETPEHAEPVLKWDEAAFDANGDAQIPMLRFPASENCMLCHSTSEQRRGFYGFGDAAKVDANVVDTRDDVHKGKSWTEKGTVRSIENCEACHAKNYYKKALDLSADHQFLTGFSDEDVRRDLNNQPKPLSCEHCHGVQTYGSPEKPAWPHSGLATILDAHRELWRNRGDMVGYAERTLDRTVQVHFNSVACQTCHITKLAYKLAYQDKPLKPRFRYRPSEDGKSRIMPYNPASRYYWVDSTNQRVLTQAERLEVTNGVDSEPKSYQDVKELKKRFDDLLKAKGFQKPNAQMIWTETNEYLISHNTRPIADTMPCTDCHERKRNGSINSALSDSGIFGKNNVRVVAELNDKTAYPKLIKEGVVKLAMPYFKLSDDGKIVENIDDVLYETKLNPFTSQLQSNKINAVSGEFQVMARDDILKDLDTDVKTTLAAQLTRKAFVFKNNLTGDNVKNIWLAANYTNANKAILPNYRFEIIASDWMDFAFVGNKKVSTLSQGEVSSSVFYFQSRCLNDALICSLGKEKLFVKLPYDGYATAPNEVGLFAVNLVSGNIIDPPKTRIPAEIIAVKSNYVILSLTQLPERAVLVDLKK